MNPAAWRDGPLDVLFVFSASAAVVIVCLMLYMASRLYARYRKSAFRSLLVSLGFILARELAQLSLALNWTDGARWLTVAMKGLHVLAFIVLNFAVFELYYRRRPRTRAWFYVLNGIGLLLAAGGLLSNAGVLGSEASGWRTPVLDVYLLALAPLFGLMFAPLIGQPRKYKASLAAAFAAQLAAMLETYEAPGSLLYAAAATVLPAVYYALLFALLFERVAELLQSAYRSSVTDGLTGLSNRRYWTSRLVQALKTRRQVGVIFCDIDNFKALNDTEGHAQADAALVRTAAILAEETAGIGLAGRYGGEELVAFVAAPGADVRAVAENIRRRVESETRVTVSVGFSLSAPDVSAEQLIRRADEAMYRSKHAGKNRVTAYGEPDRPALAGAAGARSRRKGG
jgi:diguanylate cyclase (GGDEF)-like protein